MQAGGEAASTLRLLSDYGKKKEACTVRLTHARHEWHSVREDLLLASRFIHILLQRRGAKSTAARRANRSASPDLGAPAACFVCLRGRGGLPKAVGVDQNDHTTAIESLAQSSGVIYDPRVDSNYNQGVYVYLQ